MNIIKSFKALCARKNLIKLIPAVVVAVLMSIEVTAGSGTAFQSIWDNEITALLEGEPAMIIAALILLMSLYQGIMKQNYVTALGFFIACIFMSYASDIITSFFGMGFAI
jgi:hypothetical protein